MVISPVKTYSFIKLRGTWAPWAWQAYASAWGRPGAPGISFWGGLGLKCGPIPDKYVCTHMLIYIYIYDMQNKHTKTFRNIHIYICIHMNSHRCIYSALERGI